MTRILIASTLGLSLGLSACAGNNCDPGGTTPCQCGGGSLNGLATCAGDGSAFGVCDCSAVACAPRAAQRCEGDHLFDVDACGNVDRIPAKRCACTCAPGGTTCPAWREPGAMTPGPTCTDASSCLLVEHQHCTPDVSPAGTWWVHGTRETNVCGFAIRCYVYEWTNSIRLDPDGWSQWTTTEYLGPPLWPEIAPGREVFGNSAYNSEAGCLAAWDARSATEIIYYACVRADDPPASCLPDVAKPFVDLAPVCQPGG